MNRFFHVEKTHRTAQECSNGLAGYESAGACCPIECGQCGGVGCSAIGKECCASDIMATKVACSDSGEAPCIIDGDGEGGKSTFIFSCLACRKSFSLQTGAGSANEKKLGGERGSSCTTYLQHCLVAFCCTRTNLLPQYTTNNGRPC